MISEENTEVTEPEGALAADTASTAEVEADKQETADEVTAEIVEGISEEVTEEDIDETLSAVGADAEVLTTDQVAKMVLNDTLDGFKSGVSNLNECVTVEENTTGATCTSRSAMKMCTKSDSIEGSRDVMVVVTVQVL